MSIITFKSLISGQQPQDDDIDGFYIDAEGNPPKIYFKSDDDLLEYQCRPLKGGYKPIRLWNDGINFTSINVKIGDKYQFPAVSEYRDNGTMFDGWYDSNNTKYTTESTVTNHSSSDLYARWTPIDHLVDIDIYDGTSKNPVTPVGEYKVDYWDALTKTWNHYNNGNPTNNYWPSNVVTGDVFRIYSINGSPGKELTKIELCYFDSKEVIREYSRPTSDTDYIYFQAEPYKTVLNLYFGDQAIYKMFFNTCGGNVISSGKEITNGDTYGDLPEPNYEGHQFEGWYTAETGGTKITADTVVNVSTNITLYAHWALKTDTPYTVKHYQQNLDNDNYTLKETVNASGTTGATLTLANLKKSYTGFTYLQGEVGRTVVPTTTVLADGSRVIDLYYTRNEYKLTVNTRTGVSTAGSSATKLYKYQANITLKASANTGYTWKEWTSSNTEYNKSEAQFTFKMPAENVTMTPSVTENTYTIAFNNNGGSGTMASLTGVKYTTNESLTECNFTRNGYEFAGWNTQANGKGTSYSDKTSVSKLTATNGGNVTLYAMWKITSASLLAISNVDSWSYFGDVANHLSDAALVNEIESKWLVSGSIDAADNTKQVFLPFTFDGEKYNDPNKKLGFECRGVTPSTLTILLERPNSAEFKTGGYPKGTYKDANNLSKYTFSSAKYHTLYIPSGPLTGESQGLAWWTSTPADSSTKALVVTPGSNGGTASASVGVSYCVRCGLTFTKPSTT